MREVLLTIPGYASLRVFSNMVPFALEMLEQMYPYQEVQVSNIYVPINQELVNTFVTPVTDENKTIGE